MKAVGISDSPNQVDRRTFLRVSSGVAGGILASQLAGFHELLAKPVLPSAELDSARRSTDLSADEMQNWLKFDAVLEESFGLAKIRAANYNALVTGSPLKTYNTVAALSYLLESLGMKPGSLGTVSKIPDQKAVQVFEILRRNGLRNVNLYLERYSGEVFLTVNNGDGPRMVSGLTSLRQGMVSIPAIVLDPIPEGLREKYCHKIDGPEDLTRFYGIFLAENMIRVYGLTPQASNKLLEFVNHSESRGAISPRVHVLKAYAYIGLGKFDEAKTVLTTLDKDYPQQAHSVYRDLFNISVSKGKLKAEYLEGFLKSAPAVPGNVLNLASPLYHVLHSLATFAKGPIEPAEAKKISSAIANYMIANPPVFKMPEDRGSFYRVAAAVNLGLVGVKLSSPEFLNSIGVYRTQAQRPNEAIDKAILLFSVNDWFKAKNELNNFKFQLPQEWRNTLELNPFYINGNVIRTSLPQPQPYIPMR